jgi:hypothetical protein
VSDNPDQILTENTSNCDSADIRFLHPWSIETGRWNVSEAMRKRSKIEAGRREQLALGLTAACSVALSGGVIASLIYLLLALASLMASRPAYAQSAPVGAGVRLEAGIEKEDVDGGPEVGHGHLPEDRRGYVGSP